MSEVSESRVGMQTNHCVGSDNASLGVSCYLEGVLVSSPGTQQEYLVYTAPNEAQSLIRSSAIYQAGFLALF